MKHLKRVGAFALLVSLALTAAPLLRSQPLGGDEASFALSFNGIESAYRLFPAIALPSGDLTFSIAGHGDKSTFVVIAGSGSLTEVGPGSWRWRAPERPGVYPIIVRRAEELESIQIQAMVLIPRNEVDGLGLSHFSMGRFPIRDRRGAPLPDGPPGFIRVSPRTQTLRVSSNFVLGQFTSGQTSDEQLVYVDPGLVLVLEDILKTVRHRGPFCDTLWLVAAFRTPAYARRLGTSPESLHQWGRAAEFVVDCAPRDGHFDDVNGDGRLNAHDAEAMFDWIDAFSRVRPGWPLGGLGLVRTDRRFGPHLYIDVGDKPVRWKR